MTKEKSQDGLDYYFNKQGLMVMTEHYLLKQGRCCQSGCLHCPYGFTKKVDPLTPPEFFDPWGQDV